MEVSDLEPDPSSSIDETQTNFWYYRRDDHQILDNDPVSEQMELVPLISYDLVSNSDESELRSLVGDQYDDRHGIASAVPLQIDQVKGGKVRTDTRNPRLPGLLQTVRAGIRRYGPGAKNDDEWKEIVNYFTNFKMLTDIKKWEGTPEGGKRSTFLHLGDKRKDTVKDLDMQKTLCHRSRVAQEMLDNGVPLIAVQHYMVNYNWNHPAASTNRDAKRCMGVADAENDFVPSSAIDNGKPSSEVQKVPTINTIQPAKHTRSFTRSERQQVAANLEAEEAAISNLQEHHDATDVGSIFENEEKVEQNQVPREPYDIEQPTNMKHCLESSRQFNYSSADKGVFLNAIEFPITDHMSSNISFSHTVGICTNLNPSNLSVPTFTGFVKYADVGVNTDDLGQFQGHQGVVSTLATTDRKSKQSRQTNGKLGSRLLKLARNRTSSKFKKTRSVPRNEKPKMRPAPKKSVDRLESLQPISSKDKNGLSFDTRIAGQENRADFMKNISAPVSDNGLDKKKASLAEEENLSDRYGDGGPEGGFSKHSTQVIVNNMARGELLEMSSTEREYTPDRCFSIEIETSKMEHFFNFELNSFVSNSWAECVRQAMMKVHACALVAKKSPAIPTEKNQHLYFCKMIMACKCSKSITFVLAGFTKPSQQEPYVLYGYASGEFKLEQNQKIFPGIRGYIRKLYQTELKTKSALRVYREYLLSLPPEYLHHVGPFDNVLAVFRELKYEAKKTQRHHDDTFVDLDIVAMNLAAKYTNDKLPGMVHHLTDRTGKFYLYTEEQLRFAAALNSKLKVEMKYYWDLTGGILGKLRAVDKKPLYGALMAKAKDLKEFIVAELFSTVNTAVDQMDFFSRVLSGMRIFSRSVQPNLVVIDNSDASINAVLRAWNVQTVSDYIEMCYQIFDCTLDHFPTSKTVVLLCVGHLMKAFRDNLCRKTKDTDKVHQAQKTIALYGMARYVEVQSSEEFTNVTMAVLKIFAQNDRGHGNEILDQINFLKCDKVMALVETLNKEEGGSDYMHETTVLDESTPLPEDRAEGKTIRDQSRFYLKFKSMRDAFEAESTGTQIEELQGDITAASNYYYNKAILDTIQDYMVKFPLWCTMFAQARKGFQNLERQTTGLVENHFKNEKCLLHKNLPMRAGEFVEEHETCVMSVLRHERARAIKNGLIRKNFMETTQGDPDETLLEDDKELHELEEKWAKRPGGPVNECLKAAAGRSKESRTLTAKVDLNLLKDFMKKHSKTPSSTVGTDKVRRRRTKAIAGNTTVRRDVVKKPVFPLFRTATRNKRADVKRKSQHPKLVDLSAENEVTLRCIGYTDCIIPSLENLCGLTASYLQSLAGENSWLDARVVDQVAYRLCMKYVEDIEEIVFVPHSVRYLLKLPDGGDWIEDDGVKRDCFEKITAYTSCVYYLLFIGDHFVLVKYQKAGSYRWNILVMDPLENYRKKDVKNGVEEMSLMLQEHLFLLIPNAMIPEFNDPVHTKIPGGNGVDCGLGVLWALEMELKAEPARDQSEALDPILSEYRGQLLLELLEEGPLGRLIKKKCGQNLGAIRLFIQELSDRLVPEKSSLEGEDDDCYMVGAYKK